MNEATFMNLKNAFLYNEIDLSSLIPIKFQLEPMYVDVLNSIIQNTTKINFDYKKFTELKNVTKDEIVITFLLFIQKQVNSMKLFHTFRKPYSNEIYDWIFLYKSLIYSVLSLVYNKKFTAVDFLSLDEAMLSINMGHPDTNRMLMKKMKLLSQDVKYDAETDFSHNHSYDADIYGPFVWRFLHLMAEAVDLRKGFDIEKQIWQDFTLYHLRRTLRCPICSHHYKMSIVKYKEQLKSSSDLPETWFNLHNDVNELLHKPKYNAADFKQDRELMKRMLD